MVPTPTYVLYTDLRAPTVASLTFVGQGFRGEEATGWEKEETDGLFRCACAHEGRVGYGRWRCPEVLVYTILSNRLVGRRRLTPYLILSDSSWKQQSVDRRKRNEPRSNRCILQSDILVCPYPTPRRVNCTLSSYHLSGLSVRCACIYHRCQGE